MSRPTVATIDLAALAHNARAIRDFMAGRRGGTAPAVAGVVKANAYGHGMEGVARAGDGAYHFVAYEADLATVLASELRAAHHVEAEPARGGRPA